MHGFPSYDRINKQILEYKLAVFNPSRFLRDECLVYRQLSQDALMGIGCINEMSLAPILGMVRESGRNVTVKVKKEWFF